MKEQKRKYSRLRGILEGTEYEGMAVAGKRLVFPLYKTRQFMDTELEVLELDVRSFNCLKRFGIHTLGDLVTRIHSSNDLKTIRNCGKNSIANIMDALFAYQYESLDAAGRRRFLEDLAELNGF